MKPKLTVGRFDTQSAVILLVEATNYRRGGSRNLQMPGDPHYQPKPLKPLLGYDQRVGWQIIVEWFWMATLAEKKIIPTTDAKLLIPDLLKSMLQGITTTKVAKLERTKTKHDILALLELMRRYLPKPLHRWLHFGLTSYDTISTAYALQFSWTFEFVFWPRLRDLDVKWRTLICKYKKAIQIGRTHLQDALPITVGSWLAVLHNRFAETSRNARRLSKFIPGKFSGGVGTSAAIKASKPRYELAAKTLKTLGLPAAKPSTQIPPPEAMERFLNEIFLISQVFANLGDDIRHLQASAIREISSSSSTSSTMSHKGSNPVVAEQIDGMCISVRGEFLKVLESGNSTLQRDLRYSNVMRGYAAILVFTFKQLESATTVLDSLSVDETMCRENFSRSGRLVTAELLHLSLQENGFPDAHRFVNKVIVPRARESGNNLVGEMQCYLAEHTNKKLGDAWSKVSLHIREVIEAPERYIGDAIEIADKEGRNFLI